MASLFDAVEEQILQISLADMAAFHALDILVLKTQAGRLGMVTDDWIAFANERSISIDAARERIIAVQGLTGADFVSHGCHFALRFDGGGPEWIWKALMDGKKLHSSYMGDEGDWEKLRLLNPHLNEGQLGAYWPVRS